MKTVDLMKIPRKFNSNVYYNIKTNEVISLDDVDEVLQYETELVFEDYYKNLKDKMYAEAENKIMHSYMLSRAKELFAILSDVPYMKQRDALDYLSNKSNIPNIDILVTLIKDQPRDYIEVIQKTISTIEGFTELDTIDSIEAGVLDDETLDVISSTLTQIKAKELMIDNYVNKVIKYLYLSIIDTDEYGMYLEEELKKMTPIIDEELIKAYDEYKYSKFEEQQESVANDIINLYDYVLDNKLVNWVEKDRYIYMVTSLSYLGDKAYFCFGSESIGVNRTDIKEIKREGSTFTVIL